MQLTKLGKNLRPLDSVSIIIPNAPYDSVQIYLNGKITSVKNNYQTNTPFFRYKVDRSNTLQFICGEYKTKSIKFLYIYSYIYLSMGTENCSLYFSDTPMEWEKN